MAIRMEKQFRIKTKFAFFPTYVWVGLDDPKIYPQMGKWVRIRFKSYYAIQRRYISIFFNLPIWGTYIGDYGRRMDLEHVMKQVIKRA